jgi:hypothetical protein
MTAINYPSGRGLKRCTICAHQIMTVLGCARAAAGSPESTSVTPALDTVAKPLACTAVQILTILQSMTWPALVLAIILLIAFNTRFGRVFGLVPKFVNRIKGPYGVDIEINADAAKQVRANFRDSYQEFRSQAKDEYDRMADARSVYQLLRNIITNTLPEIMQEEGLQYDPDGVRATVHVEDIVFRGYLYQLINYFPPRRGGGGAGRRFSQRYGIIGQSWRLNESIGRGMAVSGMGPSPTRSDKERATRELISRWGMTDDEAAVASHERPATLSIILRHDGHRNGVLYIDSTHADAFGADDTSNGAPESATNPTRANKLARSLERHSATVRLARAVSDVLEPLRLAAPLLEVEEGQ